MIDRRTFLRRGLGVGASLGLAPLAPLARAEAPRVRRLVRLGRTELRVSDIGFGSSRLGDDPDLVRHALDRGITYFDTAESYTGGVSETTLGKALRGRRDQVVLVSKVKGEVGARSAALMERLEASLRRLQTDHLDVYFNHAVNDPARMANPEWAAFTTLAKEQGKIRWRGMSGHGGRLVEALDHALDHDLVDVVLVAFNFGQDPAFHERLTRRFDFVARQPELPRVLAKARQRDVGVVAMKTLRGARLNDLRPYESGGATFAQAAFRWVLSHRDVDSLVVTMRSPEMIDEYLGASGWARPHRADLELLHSYESRHGRTQCRYGCDGCAGSCPHAVPIAEVLRTRMYARDYGDPELAREEYVRLGTGAETCLGCTVRSCTCPFDLPIAELTAETHRLLS